MSAPLDARAAAGRVDRLLGQLRAGPDPRAAVLAEELVRCLVQLYGAGLERVVRSLDPEQLRELSADPLVASLLLVHDLHPLDAGTRIRRALAGVPGEPRYLGIDEGGVAHVRLAGSGQGCGQGCGSSARRAVESAVRDAAPEVAGVHVEAAPAPPPLLQISRRPGIAAPSDSEVTL